MDQIFKKDTMWDLRVTSMTIIRTECGRQDQGHLSRVQCCSKPKAHTAATLITQVSIETTSAPCTGPEPSKSFFQEATSLRPPEEEQTVPFWSKLLIQTNLCRSFQGINQTCSRENAVDGQQSHSFHSACGQSGMVGKWRKTQRRGTR